MESQDYFRLCREALGITLKGQPDAQAQPALKGLYRIMFHVHVHTQQDSHKVSWISNYYKLSSSLHRKSDRLYA